MPEGSSTIKLSELGELVAREMGLHFPPERWRDLERGLRSAAGAFGFADTHACARWLLSAPLTRGQIEVLASHLTIGETYFFREPQSFEIIEQEIIPGLLRSRRNGESRLRIWSAGCATGEEPYSIAIVLHRAIPDLAEWNITLLATDINPQFLEKAAIGVYSDWSFRGMPSGVRERYFQRRKDGRFEILPCVRKMVTFSHLNLADDAYPSLWNNTNAMDIVFCRNVLMYFAPAQAQKVVRNLHHSLVERGWLLVSPSEASQTLFSSFVAVNRPGATLYRKDAWTQPMHEEAPPGGAALPWPLPPAASEAGLDPGFAENSDAQPMVSAGESERAVPEGDSADEPLILYEQGRYREAAESLQASLSRHPSDIEGMTLLVRAYANQGKLAEALEWCEKAVAVDKVNSATHYLRAILLQEQGATGEAEAAFRRTLYLDPQFVLAHVALGNLARQRGDRKRSAKHFENALGLLNRHPPEHPLPECEGITAGRLREVIQAAVERGVDG